MSRPVYDMAGVIRISDDSSTESDAGLDSDFHSSPESLVDDDVVIVDAVGLPADNRGEARDPGFPLFTAGEQTQRGGVSAHGRSAAELGTHRQSGVRENVRAPILPLYLAVPGARGKSSSSRTQG